jgi:hypothetical protein
MGAEGVGFGIGVVTRWATAAQVAGRLLPSRLRCARGLCRRGAGLAGRGGLALSGAGSVIDGLLDVALAFFCTAEQRRKLSRLSDAVMANGCAAQPTQHIRCEPLPSVGPSSCSGRPRKRPSFFASNRNRWAVNVLPVASAVTRPRGRARGPCEREWITR